MQCHRLRHVYRWFCNSSPTIPLPSTVPTLDPLTPTSTSSVYSYRPFFCSYVLFCRIVLNLPNLNVSINVTRQCHRLRQVTVSDHALTNPPHLYSVLMPAFPVCYCRPILSILLVYVPYCYALPRRETLKHETRRRSYVSSSRYETNLETLDVARIPLNLRHETSP